MGNTELKMGRTGSWASSLVALWLAGLAPLVPLIADAGTDPAARHKQLAVVVENELKLRKDSSARYQPYVHWVRLDRDQYIDAIVILKQQASSCALQPTCLGLLIQGRSDGFHVLSTFPPNQHPLYLAPLASNSSPRTLYYSDDGEDYDEIAFSNGQYRIAKRGLSEGRVRESAYWKITEREFDELAFQTIEVEDLQQAPLGAPIIVKVTKPPQVLLEKAREDYRELMNSGYPVAQKIERTLQKYFDVFARQHLLSHRVTVELVACEDWMTRVPLANQRDRSGRNVVGCLEVLGALVQEQYDQKKQLDTFIYLLTGSLGQAIAVQANLQDGVIQYLSNDSELPAELRVALATRVSTEPSLIYYLVGALSRERSFQQGQSAIQYFYHDVIDSGSKHLRGEHSVLKSDFVLRFSATYCAKVLVGSGAEQFKIESFEPFAVHGVKRIEEEVRRPLKDSEIKTVVPDLAKQFKAWYSRGLLSDEGLCRIFGQALASHEKY